MRKTPIAILAATTLAFSLGACSSEDASNVDSVILTVGASPSPHGKILRDLAENLPADAGFTLEVKEYTDYIQPNVALNTGDLDANFYQTVPFLESESQTRGYDFSSGEGIHLEPLGIYSKKVTDLADLPEKAKIGIINDPSNQSRALTLLADEGLVQLSEDVEPSVANVTPKEGIELISVEGPLLVRTLDDVDAAVINGNFAQEGGLSVNDDALVVESPEGNPAVNVLVWKTGSEKEEAIKKLEELLHSEHVSSFIEKTWTDGSVIPAF